MKFCHSILSLLTISCVAFLFSGCSSSGPDLSKYSDTNLEKVRNMYSLYMGYNNMIGPKSKEELKSFLTTDRTAKIMLERTKLDIDKFDEYFVSQRDNEEFKVRWGLKGPADHAIVFESTGIDGLRYVGFGEPIELDEEKYEGYWMGKIRPDGPASAEEIMPTKEEQQAAEANLN